MLLMTRVSQLALFLMNSEGFVTNCKVVKFREAVCALVESKRVGKWGQISQEIQIWIEQTSVHCVCWLDPVNTKDFFERIQDYQAKIFPVTNIICQKQAFREVVPWIHFSWPWEYESLCWNLNGSSRYEPLKTRICLLRRFRPQCSNVCGAGNGTATCQRRLNLLCCPTLHLWCQRHRRG